MKNYKHIIPFIAMEGRGASVILASLMLLTACSNKTVDDILGASDNDRKSNGLLQVKTRGTDESTVSYPVQVYVFRDDECQAVQTIGDGGQTLNVALVEGTYCVYAVGGAGSAGYSLPAREDATTTTSLTLREGNNLTDLMSASATATLIDGGTNSVTLGLTRKVMLVEGVTISQVPTAASAVSVTIAPLWEHLTVGGTYSGVGGAQTMALTRQGDGRTWCLDGADDASGVGIFLLPPSSQPASVSVNITVGGTTKTYTYTTFDELEAGYKVRISGRYTEAVGVTLTGTVSGAAWLGERTISFDFNESGASASAGNNTGEGEGSSSGGGGNEFSSVIPAVGDTWRGGYVLGVSDDGVSAEVTLLSPTDLTGWYRSDATIQADSDAALASLAGGGAVGGVGAGDGAAEMDWHVPNSEEARMMYNARAAIGLTGRYLAWHNGAYRLFDPTKSSFMTAIAATTGFDGSTVIRAVAVVTVNKE